MPGFSTWGESSHRMSSLTPPKYEAPYPSHMSDKGYYSQQYRNSQAGNGFNKQYQHMTSYPSQANYNPRSSTHMSMMPTHDYNQIAPYNAQMPAPRSYTSEAVVPTLPPMRTQESLDPYAHFGPSNVQVPVEQKPKEEKPTGGVAAHLDYDMGTMSDFVAEMSQGIVNSNTTVSSQYRKYVSQILSSTRLPSSTIMLGLFYLASRMKILSARGTDTRSSSTVYRMLTTCLLLGSKFLDDNTFQNRSWAEVSSIPVKELNQMELDWLKDFDWLIHGRMYDQHEGFFMWREHWLAYEEDSKMRKVKEAHKLAPIDTNMRRHHSINKPLMSPEGPIPAQYQRNSQYDTQWVSPLISEPSPPSAAYSGPATPEYYNNAIWNYGHPAAYPGQMWNSNTSTPAYAASRQSYHQAPNYVHQYNANMWPGQGHNCGCSMYGKCKDHYFLSNNYGMQTVAC